MKKLTMVLHIDIPTFIVAFQQELVRVEPFDFQNHANMNPMNSANGEIIKELHDFLPVGILRVGFLDTLEQLDLVYSCFRILRSRFHDFQGNKSSGDLVPTQPDG